MGVFPGRNRRYRPLSEVFDRYTRNLNALRAELDAFGGLLQSGTPLGETKQILPFVRRSRHLAAAFGFANHALGAPDLLAMERPLFGCFRCDVAIGSSTARQFTLVELEDARENSVFEAVKGRGFPRWSSRFERGFSQLVDWAWRIDYERQPSAALEAAFGTSDPRIHYPLVIGRDQWIGAAGRARLDWRHLHNGISEQRTTIWTSDDLFTFISDRLKATGQDASHLVRGNLWGADRSGSYRNQTRIRVRRASTTSALPLLVSSMEPLTSFAGGVTPPLSPSRALAENQRPHPGPTSASRG